MLKVRFEKMVKRFFPKSFPDELKGGARMQMSDMIQADRKSCICDWETRASVPQSADSQKNMKTLRFECRMVAK
jgi:hypothetical protein